MTPTASISRRRFVLVAAGCVASLRALPAGAQSGHVPASSIPASALVQPAQLSGELASAAPKPLLFQVGSHVLFAQAHIPGAEYIGAAGQDKGLDLLRQRVRTVAKDAPIVLYCGCCPWDRCPNIAPAYHLLHQEGFTHVRVLYLAQSFGTDWVAKNDPAASAG